MSFLVRSIFCGLLLAGAASNIAIAADTPVTNASDPHWDAHLALAKRFLEVSGARAAVASARNAVMNALPAQMHAAYPALDDAAVQTYLQAVRDGYARDGDGYFNRVAEIYARHFSEQELSDLIAFYQTDAGKKYITGLPDVVKDVTNVQAEMMGRVMRDVAQKMERQTQKGEAPAK